MARHRLVSLKRTRDLDELASPLTEDKDFFPHTLFLNEEEIEKLGIGDLEIGTERMFNTMVRVVSKSESENEDEGARRDMTLAIVKGEVSTKSRAERVFGDDDGRQD